MIIRKLRPFHIEIYIRPIFPFLSNRTYFLKLYVENGLKFISEKKTRKLLLKIYTNNVVDTIDNDNDNEKSFVGYYGINIPTINEFSLNQIVYI